MALNLSRDAKLYVSTVERDWTSANTFEVRILDGFSFSQGTESTTITVDETGAAPVRGQRMFNTALNPVDLSFSTYIRPMIQGGLVTAAERVLWEAFASKGNGVPADPFNGLGGSPEPSTTSTADSLVVDFDDSNVHVFLPLYFYLDLGAVKYKISNASMSEASLDFDLAGIATLAWTGQATRMEEALPCQFPEQWAPMPECANFITNKLSTLSLVGEYNAEKACFQIATPGTLAATEVTVTIGDGVPIAATTPVDPTAEEYARWWTDTFCGVDVSCISGESFDVCTTYGSASQKLKVESANLTVIGVSAVEQESTLVLNSTNFTGTAKETKSYALLVSKDSTETAAEGEITLTGTAGVGEVSTALVGTATFSTAAATGGETSDVIATDLAALINADPDYTSTAVGSVITLTLTTDGAAGNVTKLQYVSSTGDITGVVVPFSGGGEEGWLPITVDINAGDTLITIAQELADKISTAVGETITYTADDVSGDIILTVGTGLDDRIVLQDDRSVPIADRLLAAWQSSWRSGKADIATGSIAFEAFGSGGDRYYTIPLTGGSLSAANNITYVTPEELGVVNVPIGYFSGTRAITATFEAYLRTGEDGQTGQLLSDLLNALTEVSTSFETWLTLGGAGNDTTVEFYFPALHLSVPTINTADVISTTIEGTGQATEGLTGTDELIVTYRTIA